MKQEIISVPPEMDDRQTDDFTLSYTYRKDSLDKGDPVDKIVRRLVNLCDVLGTALVFWSALMYFALVPLSLIHI